MAGLTDAGEAIALDAALGVSPAANRWLALYTAAPSESSAGTEVTNANAYARQPVTFAAASGGASSNSATVTWPAATGSWGTVVAVGIVTSATHGAGSVLGVGTFTGVAVAAPNVFEILAGDLDVTLD